MYSVWFIFIILKNKEAEGDSNELPQQIIDKLDTVTSDDLQVNGMSLQEYYHNGRDIGLKFLVSAEKYNYKLWTAILFLLI